MSIFKYQSKKDYKERLIVNIVKILVNFNKYSYKQIDIFIFSISNIYYITAL